MRTLVLLSVASVALSVCPAVSPAQTSQRAGLPATQSPGQTTTPRGSLPPLDGRSATDPDDPTAALRQAQIARAQMSERHKRIVDETGRLLKLATELKEDVDKTNKDEMSLEVIRKADEVERLAHDVKTRMKG